MEPLTIETLRTLAQAHGLTLSDDELSELLPLVQAGRKMMEAVAEMPLADAEPSSQYRMF